MIAGAYELYETQSYTINYADIPALQSVVGDLGRLIIINQNLSNIQNYLALTLDENLINEIDITGINLTDDTNKLAGAIEYFYEV